MKKHLFTLLVLFISTLAFAQEASQEQPIPEGKVSTTQHRITIDGTAIEYTAKAGTMQLKDEENKPIALFGYTSYVKTNGNNDSRPIVFAYNGGPGSSSYWLHMGVLGPKRIVVKDPEFTPAAPYKLVENNYSILDKADLVMLDPVGTGLSVPIGEAEYKDFWGVDQDIRSIALFIRQYLIENGRMNSPKFLLGESYGTLRNAGVMNELLNQGFALNGVIMVSAVFDLRTLIFPPNEDLPYVVHFPTYAATARYHDRVADKKESLETFLDEVRTFTEEEYAPALFKGDQISEENKQAMAQKLEDYTGVDQEFWLKADLRVTNSEFFQEFMNDEGMTVGRLDSRFTGYTLDPLMQNADYDPQSLAISPAYTAGFLDYFHNELGVDRSLRYAQGAYAKPGFKWDWTHGPSGFLGGASINTGPDMARAMTYDPNVKVLILNGYYDIATVFYGVEHTIDHLGLTPEIKDNIIMKYYEAGHMMYTHQPSLEKFKTDVAKFIEETAVTGSKDLSTR